MEGASPEQRFERIIVSGTMLPDHLAGSYIEGLRDVLQRLADGDSSP